MGRNQKNYNRKKQKQSGKGLLIAGLSLVAVAMLGAVILLSGFFQIRAKKEQTNDISQEASAPDKPVQISFPEKDDLILYLGSSQKNQDGSFALTVKLICGENLRDQTIYVEAGGTTVFSVANSGMETIDGSFTATPGENEAVILQAKAGDKVSNEVPFYGAVENPEDDFLNRPLDVLDGLDSYLAALGTSDYYSEETLARLEAYLNADPAVASVTRVGSGLSFVTTDNYLGSYGLGHVTEDIAGFSDGKQVYADYSAGGSVSDRLIEAKSFPTNDKFLVITPEYSEDEVMRYHTDFSIPMLNEMRTALGLSGTCEVRKDYDAIDCIRNGEFTDYGLVELNAHGLILQNQLFINLGNGSKNIQFTNEEGIAEKGSEKVLDGMARVAYVTAMKEYLGIKDLPGEAGQYFRTNVDDAPGDDTIAHSFETVAKAVYNRSVMVSSSYLDYVLEGKTFDNTILYLFVCSARSDGTFVQHLKDHGAALVYGCQNEFNTSVSLLSLARITQALQTKRSDGIYEAYTTGAYSVDAASSAELVRQMAGRNSLTMSETRQPQNMVNSYQDSANERPAADCAPENENMSLKGNAVIKGRVLSGTSAETGVPLAGAEVKAYRWIDHSFRELASSAVTDAEGYYRLENVECGFCILEARNGETKAFVAHETGEQVLTGKQEEEAEPILFSDPSLMVRASVTKESNEYYELELVSCRVQIPGQPEAEAAVNARLQEYDINAENVAADMRTSTYQSWYKMQLIDAYAGGCAGSVLMSDSTYYGGAHPFHAEFGDNFDLETGEKLTLAGMLNPQNPAARESLKSLMLEYMNGWDGADALRQYAPFEENAERSLNGEAGGFQLTADGLRIFYYQYEIGPYVAGMPDYTIPWNRLAGIINSRYLPASHQASQGSAAMTSAASPGLDTSRIKGEPASYA